MMMNSLEVCSALCWYDNFCDKIEIDCVSKSFCLILWDRYSHSSPFGENCNVYILTDVGIRFAIHFFSIRLQSLCKRYKTCDGEIPHEIPSIAWLTHLLNCCLCNLLFEFLPIMTFDLQSINCSAFIHSDNHSTYKPQLYCIFMTNSLGCTCWSCHSYRE